MTREQHFDGFKRWTVSVFEDYWRIVAVLALGLWLALQYSDVLGLRPRRSMVPMTVAVGAYAVYVAIVQLAWRRARGYSLPGQRAFRNVLDCLFPIAMVACGSGPTSAAVLLLIPPVFKSSYRQRSGRGLAILGGVAIAYAASCALSHKVWALPNRPFDWGHLFANIFILGFVWYASRYSWFFLLRRLSCLSKAMGELGSAAPPHVHVKELARIVTQGLGSELCLVLRKRRFCGEYRVAASVGDKEFPAGESLPFLHNAPDMRGTHVLTRQEAQKTLGSEFVEVVEQKCLDGRPMESCLVARGKAPDKSDFAIVAVNAVIPALAGKARIRAFRDDDRLLMSLAVSESLMRVLWQAEACSLLDMLDIGIADEITVMDEQKRVLFLNAARREFFDLRPGECLGEPCHQVFLGCKGPMTARVCQGCKFGIVLGKDIQFEWDPEFVHFKTGHPHSIHCIMRSIIDAFGENQIVETVRDTTLEGKYAKLNGFLTWMQTRRKPDDPAEDEKEVINRVLALFSELNWRRSRLYRWEDQDGEFVCIGARGQDEDKVLKRRISVRWRPGLVQQDIISAKWALASPVEPLPKLIALTGHKTREFEEYVNSLSKNGKKCVVYWEDQHQFPELMEGELPPLKLEFPFVQGGKLVGKVALDNMVKRNAGGVQQWVQEYRFDETDLEIAKTCAAILGHVL